LAFEHRLYLPSIGLFIALISLADYALRRLKSSEYIPQPRATFMLLLVILFSGSSLLTTQRNHDWRDELSIYRDCAIKSPNKPRAQVNYGLALARAGNYDEAIVAFDNAIALGIPFYESYLSAATNIILSLAKQGNNPEALKRGAELFRGIPDNADVLGLPHFLHNLAYIYYVENDFNMALESIKSALTLNIPFAADDTCYLP
jgi:protein O-mannosyl-transferase